MNDNNELKGLNGWLILVGIGVVISPIRLLITLVPSYQPIFEDGTWEALTTVGSESYTPYFGSLLIGEMVFNAIMFAASIYLIYLFFSKHHLFPKLYIVIVMATLIFIPLDAWLVTQLFPSLPMFDTETTTEFLRAVLVAAIWIPYMIISKRVKATFVEHIPGKKSHSPNHETPEESAP